MFFLFLSFKGILSFSFFFTRVFAYQLSSLPLAIILYITIIAIIVTIIAFFFCFHFLSLSKFTLINNFFLWVHLFIDSISFKIYSVYVSCIFFTHRSQMTMTSILGASEINFAESTNCWVSELTKVPVTYFITSDKLEKCIYTCIHIHVR